MEWRRWCGVMFPGGAGLDRTVLVYPFRVKLANAIPGADVKLSRGEMTAE